MVTKEVTYRFAGIEFNPKFRTGRVCDVSDIAWHEESWAKARTVGSARFETFQTTREGAGAPGHSSYCAWYDIRVLPDDAQSFLRDTDARILALRQERQQFLTDHFREWRPATRDDCSRVIPRHMTKAEATQAAKVTKRVCKADVESERKFVGIMKETFSKVLR